MEGEYSRQTSKGMVHIPVVLVPHQRKCSGQAVDRPASDGRLDLHLAEENGAEKTTLAQASISRRR